MILLWSTIVPLIGGSCSERSKISIWHSHAPCTSKSPSSEVTVWKLKWVVDCGPAAYLPSAVAHGPGSAAHHNRPHAAECCSGDSMGRATQNLSRFPMDAKGRVMGDGWRERNHCGLHYTLRSCLKQNAANTIKYRSCVSMDKKL